MNTKFTNARILTMAPGEEVYEGSLYTKDDRIVYAGPALTAEEAKITERRKADERARLEAEKVEMESKAAVVTATKEEEEAAAEYEAAKLALSKAQNDLDSANQMKAEEDARIAAEKAEKEARIAAEKAIEEARIAAAKAEEARQAALLAEQKAKAAAAKAEEEARIAAAKAEEIAKLRAAAGIADPEPAKPALTLDKLDPEPAVEPAPMRPAVRPGSEAAPTRPAAKPAV